MMFDARKDNSGCGYEEVLIDFVYGELEDKERLKFEQHMSSCSSCYSESEALGGVSVQIREWKEDHFDNSLLPNVAAAIAAERVNESATEERKGFFGIFSGWQTSLAGGMAAIVLLALVGWALLGSGTSDNQMADNNNGAEEVENKAPSDVEENPIASVASNSDESEKNASESETNSVVEQNESITKPEPIKAVNRVKVRSVKKPVQRVVKKRVNKKPPVKKEVTPKQNEVEAKIERLSPLMAEADDTSSEGLSLTDLFEGEVEDDK